MTKGEVGSCTTELDLIKVSILVCGILQPKALQKSDCTMYVSIFRDFDSQPGLAFCLHPTQPQQLTSFNFQHRHLCLSLAPSRKPNRRWSASRCLLSSINDLLLAFSRPCTARHAPCRGCVRERDPFCALPRASQMRMAAHQFLFPTTLQSPLS